MYASLELDHFGFEVVKLAFRLDGCSWLNFRLHQAKDAISPSIHLLSSVHRLQFVSQARCLHQKHDLRILICSSSFWWFWSVHLFICFQQVFCWTWPSLQGNLAYVLWIYSDFSSLFALFSISLGTLGTNTSAFCGFPSVSGLQFLPFLLFFFFFLQWHISWKGLD